MQQLANTMIRYISGKAASYYVDEIRNEEQEVSYKEIVDQFKQKFEGEKEKQLHYQDLNYQFLNEE
jgi:hypothetical protein